MYAAFLGGAIGFQCSSASRKFLNNTRAAWVVVSDTGFSALQRAENSSMTGSTRQGLSAGSVSVLFSEPKIPQFTCEKHAPYQQFSFSALQRAENSSMQLPSPFPDGRSPFQCSSASRKFLNQPRAPERVCDPDRFQCSSASRKFLNRALSSF